MSLDRYGVLIGRVEDKYYDKDDSPHLHMLVTTPEKFDISVNVKSGVLFSTNPREGVPPNQVLFLVQDPFEHPITDDLKDMEPVLYDVPREAGGIALDFIRGNLFDPAKMQPLPHNMEGENNDLFDKIGFYVAKAIADPEARVYAFGEPWPRSDKENFRFKFTPDQGIHDIHMNQGNDPGHVHDDGVWQDGGLLFRFGDQWVGIFIAFQAQCWHTDDETGRAIDGKCPKPTREPDNTGATNNGKVRIISATPDPFGPDGGQEIVHLFNVTDSDIDVSGWRLLDRRKKYEILEGVIKANDCMRVTLSGRYTALSNSGDTLTLLDNERLKVHGVSYVRQQVKRGISILFS